MTNEDKERILNNAVAFMSRSQINANEAQIYLESELYLKQEIAKLKTSKKKESKNE